MATADDSTSQPFAAAEITLTRVLALDRTIVLHGRRISDLTPLGDLGLGLDPEGPVGFALIRAFSCAGRHSVLPMPLVLSVFGQGRAAQADDPGADVGERSWQAAAGDRALRVDIRHGTLEFLLAGSPQPGPD